MQRDKIDKRYRWDLSAIIASDSEWEKRFDSFNKSYQKVTEYDGKLDNAKTIKQALDLLCELSCELEKLTTYAHMHKHEDSKVDKYAGFADRVTALGAEFSATTSFVAPQLSRLEQSFLK
ncbi:MAG: hypothetical protein LBU60_03750, partial [Clostridiales bacterium]|nr:hypothetical protein [Clostridiales bacterium]